MATGADARWLASFAQGVSLSATRFTPTWQTALLWLRTCSLLHDGRLCCPDRNLPSFPSQKCAYNADCGVPTLTHSHAGGREAGGKKRIDDRDMRNRWSQTPRDHLITARPASMPARLSRQRLTQSRHRAQPTSAQADAVPGLRLALARHAAWGKGGKIGADKRSLHAHALEACRPPGVARWQTVRFPSTLASACCWALQQQGGHVSHVGPRPKLCLTPESPGGYTKGF